MITADQLWKSAPRGRLKTGIGSLPHHNVDSAIEYAFQHSIPFLPQIPIRNAAEFMLAQALDGLPGLIAGKDGHAAIDPERWAAGSHSLQQQLDQAFSKALDEQGAFEEFEPQAHANSCWRPFLYELTERTDPQSSTLAKVEIAGPLTCQWAIQIIGDRPLSAALSSDLESQIYRLILARAISMGRRLQKRGATPLLYLDEPALYVFSKQNPKHILAFQELRLMIQALRKESVLVGLHCCSNTDWEAVLSLDLNVISLDTHLSLADFLKHQTAVTAFIEKGGRLSLGLVPTARPLPELEQMKAADLEAELMETAQKAWEGKKEILARALNEAIYTPSCGLALETPACAEKILGLL